MQIGNWVPIDKRMKKFLPKTRIFTELEAIFSLSIDYDNKNEVTELGYSKLWGWSRTKVSNFLEEVGVVLVYPDETQKTRKQKRHIEKHKEDNEETLKRHIRFIDSKWLKETKNNKKTTKKQQKNNEKDTTIDPSLNPDPNPVKKTSGQTAYSEAFERWWLMFPKRDGRVRGKKNTYPYFSKILQSEYQDLKTATINYSREEHIRDPERFLKNGWWKDFIGEAESILQELKTDKSKMTTRELIDQMQLEKGQIIDVTPKQRQING